MEYPNFPVGKSNKSLPPSKLDQRDSQMSKPPEPVERPKLARWMWDRKLKPRDAEGPLEVSAEMVRKYCLEFGHPDRAVPGDQVLARIVSWTGGDIAERDFYPPHIRGEVSAVTPRGPAVA